MKVKLLLLINVTTTWAEVIFTVFGESTHMDKTCFLDDQSFIVQLLFFWLQRAEKIIQSHNASVPLFLYMAFQNVHEPLQAPKKYTDKYSFIKDRARRTYAGMVDSMDEAIGNITETMKEAGYGSFRNRKKESLKATT